MADDRVAILTHELVVIFLRAEKVEQALFARTILLIDAVVRPADAA